MSTTASSDARTVIEVKIVVNAITHRLELDSTVTLLDALREHLELLGSKKACDQGACGACTVLLDLLEEGRTGTDAEIREFMSGNLCAAAPIPTLSPRSARSRRHGVSDYGVRIRTRRRRGRRGRYGECRSRRVVPREWHDASRPVA